MFVHRINLASTDEFNKYVNMKPSLTNVV